MISLTKSERAILEVFWTSNSSLCVKDILLSNPKLNKNTVPVAIRKLIEKDFVEVDYVGKHKKALTQYFKATITKEEFFQNQLSKNNLTKIVANFIESNESNEELDYLEQLIAQKQEELRKGR